VSEQNGFISIAHHGELRRGIDSSQLLDALQELPA